jgi:hypothetical protein
MPETVTKILNVAIESFFKKAVLYKEDHCDDTIQKCLEAYSSYGLRATQISLRAGDAGFNYDVSFVLFNGNGTFKISAEKLEIHFQNIVGDKDAEVVADCIAKLHEHVPLPEIDTTTIVANAHATLGSPEALQQYLLRYADPAKHIAQGGTIAYIRGEMWAEEIRLMVDRSLVFSDGVFLTWSTSFAGGKLTRETLKVIGDAFQQAAATLDLTPSKVEK